MQYADRRFWLVHNGEIYNFIELRSELEREGHRFHSASDSEVVLAAYAQWGPSCFARFRGMWGMVLFDAARRELILSRDRLGIKPLYLWRGRELVAVASEIKQFLELPDFAARIEPTVVDEYLATGYEDSDRTFFRDVHAVPAGAWLRIPLDTMRPGDPVAYWNPERIEAVVDDPAEAGRLFEGELRRSVRLHLRSDVPVGCALSGGLDSSAVAVLMDDLRPADADPMHTFSATFPGEANDERDYIDAALSAIRATPHFVTPTADGFLADLDDFVRAHDEPVGGLSVYAGYCVAREAHRAAVPVTLNGQGGDEILSGYWQTYFLHLRGLLRRGRFLALGHHFAGALLSGGNPQLVGQVPVMLRRYRARTAAGNGGLRLRPAGTATVPRAFAGGLLDMDERDRRVAEIRAMFLPRLLKWDDRNSMAFAVEGRYPFLDHELIELCLSFDAATLYSRGWVKWPLRIGLRNRLPESIARRRSKLGFEVPQDAWLCGPLRQPIETWLASDRPAWDLVDRGRVRELADRTWSLAGRVDEPGQALLRVFFLDRWLELFGVSV